MRKSQYKKMAEQFHQIPSKPTNLMEDKDIEGMKLFVEDLQRQNGIENDMDADQFFGYNPNDNS